MGLAYAVLPFAASRAPQPLTHANTQRAAETHAAGTLETTPNFTRDIKVWRDALPRHCGRRQRVHTPMPDVHPAVPAAAREHAFLEEAPLQPEDKLRVVVVLLQRPMPRTLRRRRANRLRRRRANRRLWGSEGGGLIGDSGQAPERRRSLSLAPKRRAPKRRGCASRGQSSGSPEQQAG